MLFFHSDGLINQLDGYSPVSKMLRSQTQKCAHWPSIIKQIHQNSGHMLISMKSLAFSLWTLE